jgi:hypothetical protein
MGLASTAWTIPRQPLLSSRDGSEMGFPPCLASNSGAGEAPGARDQRRTEIVSHVQNETARGRKEVHKRGGIDMAPIPSLRELDSMTEEQRSALLKDSAAALARNFKDIENRKVFLLLNNRAVRKWLSTDLPPRQRRIFVSDKV